MFRSVRCRSSLLIGGLSFACVCCRQTQPSSHWTFTIHSPVPDKSATWPWKDAVASSPFKGVSLWYVQSTNDYTSLELYRFDFKTNPHLRFAIYDQDQDDNHPFDNQTDFFSHGVGWVTHHLNEGGKGKVLLAWNGLFFSFLPKHAGSNQLATHIGPVVIDGKTHYNVGQHRWTFGVSYDKKGMPHFEALFKPGESALAKFSYAADGAQCLIHDGKPLRLPPPSDPSVLHPRGGAPSTDQDVGAIPVVDDIKTSRTSIGWSKDSRYLYVLIVGEPDTETGSINAFRTGSAQVGGWNVVDLQTFWKSMGVYGAINSDGGMETQRTWLLPDNRYELLKPQLSSPGRKVILDRDCTNAPEGGTLMTFYVAEK